MIEQLTDKVRLLLLDQFPTIQKRVTEQIPVFLKKHGLKGVQFVTDDQRLRPLFETAYQSLPLPIRMLVKQHTFVNFCLSQKENLLGKWLDQPEEVETEAPPTKPKASTVKTAAKKPSAGTEMPEATAQKKGATNSTKRKAS